MSKYISNNNPIDWLGWVRAMIPIMLIFSSIIISYHKLLSGFESNKTHIEVLQHDVELLKTCNGKIDSLDRKVEKIDEKLDRTLINYPWNKIDDYYFMQDFSRINELNMPEHTRVLPDK